MANLLLYTAAFSTVVFTTLGLLQYLGRRRRWATNRLEELASLRGNASPENRGGLSSIYASLMPKIGAKLLPSDQSKRSTLEVRLLHAGFSSPMALYVFAIVRLMLMTAPGLVAVTLYWSGLLTGNQFLAILFCGIGSGMLVPSLWLDGRKARRQLLISRSLPDFFDLLTTCLEAGLSLEASLKRVTSELIYAHPMLASELKRVESEINLGATASAAINSFGDRTDLDAIRSLGNFVKQARQFGTSMGEALRTHAEMIRTKREQRAEELAQKAAVKVLIPTLLLIFPSVFIVLAGPAVIQLSENLGSQESSTSIHQN